MKSEYDGFSSRRIEILREDVSRKIAAGEVIDRPFAVIRELVDNAIDAGAASIDVYIDRGGLAGIRVVDDGQGMSREDLALCTQRHATSKIREEGDLYRVRTLGFRGEALASIAACSRLQIVTRSRSERSSEIDSGKSGGERAAGNTGVCAGAFRLRVAGTGEAVLEECQGNPGTVVTVEDLFFNLPVRRKFLKSTAAESAMCRQTVLEKTLPHPDISFRLFVDGRLKAFFPLQALKERAAAAFAMPAEHFALLESGTTAFSLRAVTARPEIARRDRRLVQIYVNRRRIYEYSLIHAVEYAYSGYLPGGQYPLAFIFLELDPEQVDFNIHPAKREARFRDLPSLHQAVVVALKGFLRSFDLRAPGRPADSAPAGRLFGEGMLPFAGAPGSARPSTAPFTLSGRSYAARPRPEFPVEQIPAPSREAAPAAAESGAPGPAGPSEGDEAREPVYLGQLFNLFLLVEYGASLFIVDQHAAHERLLFEQLCSRKLASQELLMPIRLEVGKEGSRFLQERKQLFDRLAIRIDRCEDQAFEITALPEELLCIEEEELVQALLLEKGSLQELEDRLYSLAACRLAVKEGDALDPLTATELVRRVFRLSNARCPHGRPVWYELRREQLLREVGRL